MSVSHMSEETESFENTSPDIEALSHSRILLLMLITIVLLSIYGFIFVSWQFGVGALLGGIFSFVNYYWLKHTLSLIFNQADEGELPMFSGTRFILRYILLGLILLIIYLTKSISVVAFVLALSSFAFAVVIEGFIRIFASFKK